MNGFAVEIAILVIPLAAAGLLAVLPGYKLTARLNMAASLATLIAALLLFVVPRPDPGRYLLIDDLNVVFVVLNAFVAFTTAMFSASYIGHELETGRLTPAYLRFYHAMYQLLMFGMNLALIANNIGVMWVAIELATLTTVLMVGIYRTHEALEAAWKYFILGSVGIALALFGTILVYHGGAAGDRRRARRHGVDGAGRQRRASSTRRCSTSPSSSCCSATAPRSAWRRCMPGCPTPMPRARRRSRRCSPACCSTWRSMRCCASSCCWRPTSGALAPGPLMVVMGLGSLVFAAFMLYRRRDIKRFFAYSSIEHMGIIAFAFGMGGPLANFAGLYHMVMHSLTKSGIFFAVGHVAQVKGTQKIADIKGLTASHPVLGWTLALGVVAIAGLPPLGRLHERVSGRLLDLRPRPAARDRLRRRPAGRIRRADAAACRGWSSASRTGSTAPVKASYVPMFVHFGLVLVAGFYMPPMLVVWFEHIARLLG